MGAVQTNVSLDPTVHHSANVLVIKFRSIMVPNVSVLIPHQGMFKIFEWILTLIDYWESVADSVIQATGTVEFEDGLWMGVLQEDCLCPYSGCATLEYDMARPWRPALTQVECSPRKLVQYEET